MSTPVPCQSQGLRSAKQLRWEAVNSAKPVRQLLCRGWALQQQQTNLTILVLQPPPARVKDDLCFHFYFAGGGLVELSGGAAVN
jgi:hypothetical protein